MSTRRSRRAQYGLLPKFQALDPPPAVLVLTMSEDPPVLAAALQTGARGYIVKGAEPADIVRALQGVARGQLDFGEQIADALLRQGRRI